jgi:hypothetical protein
MAGTAHAHHSTPHSAPAYPPYTRVPYTPTHHHTTHAQHSRQGTGHSKPASCYGPARPSTAGTAGSCTRHAPIRYVKWQRKRRAEAPCLTITCGVACAYAVHGARSVPWGVDRPVRATMPRGQLPRRRGQYTGRPTRAVCPRGAWTGLAGAGVRAAGSARRGPAWRACGPLWRVGCANGRGEGGQKT